MPCRLQKRASLHKASKDMECVPSTVWTGAWPTEAAVVRSAQAHAAAAGLRAELGTWPRRSSA